MFSYTFLQMREGCIDNYVTVYDLAYRVFIFINMIIMFYKIYIMDFPLFESVTTKYDYIYICDFQGCYEQIWTEFYKYNSATIGVAAGIGIVEVNTLKQGIVEVNTLKQGIVVVNTFKKLG